jgi:hypothetical protein
MLGVIHAEFCVILIAKRSVIMLSVVMLSVVAPSETCKDVIKKESSSSSPNFVLSSKVINERWQHHRTLTERDVSVQFTSSLS